MSEQILMRLKVIIDGDEWHYDAVSRKVTGPDDEQFVIPNGIIDEDAISDVIRLVIGTWRDAWNYGEQYGRKAMAAEFRKLLNVAERGEK